MGQVDLRQFIKGEERFCSGGGSGIHVAFGADRNFARPLGGAVTSVLAHNPGADIYIFTDELDAADKERLLRTADKYNGGMFSTSTRRRLRDFPAPSIGPSLRIFVSCSVSCMDA